MIKKGARNVQHSSPTLAIQPQSDLEMAGKWDHFSSDRRSKADDCRG